MSTHWARSSFALACGATLTLASGWAASATPDEQAAAQALFDEGLRLLDGGKAHEACPKLEESDRLDPSPSTKFQLASCFEATGRTASAWALFVAVADSAGKSRNAKAETIARERAQRLVPKLPKLVLVPSSGLSDLPDLVVRRDGREVGRGMLGVAVPVDPGPHEVVVTARGRDEARASATAVEGKTVQLTVPLPPPSAQVATTPTTPGSETTTGSSASTSTKPRTSGWVYAGWAGVGLGAVGIATGAILALGGKSAYDDAGQYCGSAIGAQPDVCNQTGYDKRSDAVGQANAGTWLLVGGSVLAAAGVTILLVAPKSSHGPATRGSTSLMIGAGSLGLRGEF